MSSRNRVELRAKRIYEYLKERQGTPFRMADVFNDLDLQDGKTTRTAVRHARSLAEADGLYMAIPVYDNGYTTGVTDDPKAAIDAALWLSTVETGVRVPKKIADDFVKARMAQLSPSERAYVHLQDKVNELVASTQQSAHALVKALMDERRERRNDDGEVA